MMHRRKILAALAIIALPAVAHGTSGVTFRYKNYLK